MHPFDFFFFTPSDGTEAHSVGSLQESEEEDALVDAVDAMVDLLRNVPCAEGGQFMGTICWLGETMMMMLTPKLMILCLHMSFFLFR